MRERTSTAHTQPPPADGAPSRVDGAQDVERVARLDRIERVERAEGVVKFATRLSDGALIESVVVPMRLKESDGAKRRNTLCMSTQVGCRMGCAFCATGRMGLTRNLSAYEITGQVDTARALDLQPDNLVFMGMGEPLDNYDNLAAAIRTLVTSLARDGQQPQAFSASQMIVSTCGLVSGLDRLATLGLRKLVLAVSINAPNDEMRTQIMPINRRHPLGELRNALLRYPLRRNVFLAEYVVFRGFNDAREHARELAEYLRPFRSCVNLIPFNPPEGETRFQAPTIDEVEQFKRWLNDEGQYARRRESKGTSIAAACGQLATRT